MILDGIMRSAAGKLKQELESIPSKFREIQMHVIFLTLCSYLKFFLQLTTTF